MFDFHCKYTTFFWDDQIFADSEAYNSIKVDKTRYNSMTRLFHVVTLHSLTDPKALINKSTNHLNN